MRFQIPSIVIETGFSWSASKLCLKLVERTTVEVCFPVHDAVEGGRRSVAAISTFSKSGREIGVKSYRSKEGKLDFG